MSYESIGSYELSGFGDLGAASSCGTTTSRDEPAGLSTDKGNWVGYIAGKEWPKICLPGPIADECNQSSNPSYCYYAKAYGKKYLGRGTDMDIELWKSWHPGSRSASGGGAGDDTMLYVGVGVAAVAVLAGAWFLLKK